MSDLDRYVNEVDPFRERILRRVRDRATVLDVGAWTGAMGGWLIANANATVDGVERDEAAAGRIEGYRRVVNGSIEDPAVQAELKGYDVILFLDVLEHVADPAAVLRAARGWLAPGGAVLCSIPNAAHWRVRLMLLRGHFDYADSGLLDSTHLRWFTRSTARDLIESSGYRVAWEDAIVPQHPRVKVPRRALRPELFGYQFLFEATPE